MQLKLFVWRGFAPDYKGGLAFAIAEYEAEATRLVIEAAGYEPVEWGELTIYPVTHKIAAAVSGGQ
jgi:hypothetical protein